MEKYTEQERELVRKEVWNNCIDLFNKRKGKTMNSILKSQRKFINELGLLGKNKYKSVEYLETYFKSEDRALAEQVFWNSIYNKVKTTF